MSIRAGIATQEITPENKVYLAGFSGTPRLSSGIRDTILASAVHLRGGSGGIVLISLDLLSLDKDTAETISCKIAEATGTPKENIFIGTTGTHSAPITRKSQDIENYPDFIEQRQDYLDFLTERTLRAASESTVSSRPVSVATVDLDEPNSGAVFVQDTYSHRIIASIIVHPHIPNCLGPENTEISSDFVHAIRVRLAARFGVEPVIVFFAGPSGDSDAPEADANAFGTAVANTLVSKLKNLKASDFSSNIRFSGKLTAKTQDKPETRTITIGETNILGIPRVKTKKDALSIAEKSGTGNAWICELFSKV